MRKCFDNTLKKKRIVLKSQFLFKFLLFFKEKKTKK